MEKEEPLVSIVINNFNKASYIEECLQSVIDQTYKNWEIIFWDDNSTDGSVRVVDMFYMMKILPNPNINNNINKKLYKFTTYKQLMNYKDLNVPLGVTRRAAVQKCTGKYIAFLDSDDVWKPNKLKKQIDYFNCFKNSIYDPKLIFTDMQYIDESSKKKYRYKTFLRKYPPPNTDPFFFLLSRYNFIPMSTVMVERNALFDVMGQSTHYTSAEDYDWWLKIANKYEIKCLNEPLVYYRIVEDSLNHGKKQRVRAQWYEIDAVREALSYRKLTMWQKLKVYIHLIRLYCELIYKEIQEKL